MPSTPSPFQAQKEELQSLMRQPKGLEEENAQLRGAVQQGQASQRALEAELQQLRARLQGLEADCVRGTDGVCLSWGRGPQGGRVTKEQGPRGQEPGPGFPQQKEGLEAETQALRRELERQQRLLGSVQGLERGVRDADRGDPAHTGLAQKLPGLEGWGQHPGLSANASEAWGHGSPFQSSRERSGKEKWRGSAGVRAGGRNHVPGQRREERVHEALPGAALGRVRAVLPRAAALPPGPPAARAGARALALGRLGPGRLLGRLGVVGVVGRREPRAPVRPGVAAAARGPRGAGGAGTAGARARGGAGRGGRGRGGHVRARYRAAGAARRPRSAPRTRPRSALLPPFPFPGASLD